MQKLCVIVALVELQLVLNFVVPAKRSKFHGIFGKFLPKQSWGLTPLKDCIL